VLNDRPENALSDCPNYVINDIALADYGRAGFKIAETECPQL
jgi:S-adenosylhomocysteine hydrolase